MTDFNNLKCPTCGANARFNWHGNSPFIRYGSLQCPAKHHCVRVTYQKDSINTARASLIKQWEELCK